MATAYIVGSAQAGSAAAEKLHENASRAATISRQTENTRHNPPSASTVAYLAGKRKYGSSSAWYDSAAQTAKDKQSFVDKLKQQIDYRKQNEWANSIGGGIDELYGVKNSASEGVKTVEELQKELAAAERQLANAEVDLQYATEWRHYDADMEWMDTVKNSGQDWGFVSDNLGTMASNLEAKYNEQLAAYTEAQKQNERIDLARRQGGVPAEVGYTYTSPEQLAQMYAELQQTGELRDMASRRYNYSLDELATDKQAVQRGQLMGQHLLDIDAQNAERNMEAYVQNHVKGDTLGALRESYRNDKSAYRPTEEWNDTQRNRYYVLLDRQGEHAANDYAVKINSYINATKEEEASQKYYDWGYAQDATWYGKTLRGLAGTAATVAAMPGELGEYINKVERVAYTGAYVGDGELKLHDVAGAITQGRAESLNELGTVGGKGLGDVYQLTNSMAQSLVYGNIAGTAGTLTLFFGSAANQGFDDAISRGATGEQAMAFGMLSGVAEAAAELVPLENLLNADKALTRGFLKSAMIQAGLEGLEEGETNVMNALADQLVMGDKSAMNQAIQERMAAGESYEDAAKAEWGNFVKDTVWSMLGGAISGAGAFTLQYGKHMISSYQMDENGASIYGASAEQLGREAAAVTGNKKLSDLGKKVETKAKAGDKITNYTAKKLAEGTNRVSIVNATEQQVKERVPELNDKDARALANAIVSESRGEKNGPGNQKLIEKHRDIADTLLKELGKDGEVAEWAQKIGVRGVEQIKYGNRDIVELEKLKDDIDADAPTIVEADMSADVSIGDVSGTVSGLKLSNGKPQFVVTNSEGKEQYVNVDEAISSGALPAGMARLAYESLGLGDAATEVYNLYNAGQNVSEYVAAMDEAISIAADVSKREAFDKSETVQGLTAEQKDFAWNYGQQQRSKKQESRKANKSSKRKPAKAGTVSFDGVTINGTTYKATSKDKVKAADLRVIERIAKAANVNVVFYESDSIDGMYQGANGFYRNGTVYLDVHAAASKTTQQDAILLTAAHELTHHIRMNAEAQYDALKEFVIEHLLEQGQDFETMVQDKLKEKGMKRSDAVEEVIADACEMVLKDSKAAEKLAKENKSLAQTIADWLHGFYEDIKAAFEGVEARSKEAKAMTDYMDELVKLWDDALIEASKGESKPSNVIRYSFRKSTSGMANDKLSPYNEELSQYIKNGGDYIIDSFDALESAVNMAFDSPDKKATLYFGNVSPEDISRIEVSIENLPTELKGKLFKPGRTYSVIATLDSIRHLKDEKNISTENVLKYMDRYADTVVDFDDVHFDYYFDSYGNRLNGLRFRKQFDDGFQVSFDIVSNKKRSLALITEFIGGKTIKKKSAKTLPLNNSEAHTPKARAGQTSINIIDEVAGNVNTDSEGNTLSQEQQEYFKDSKVRDADGKPLVMYHQTANDFTVFDPRRNGAGSSDTETPYGIFLKSSPDDIGLKGKKQMMLYANITNPLVASNREELREKLFELSGEYGELYEEAVRIDEEYHQKYLQLDEQTVAAIRKWRQDNPEGTRREAFESPEVKRLRERARKLLDEDWPSASRSTESKAKEAINLALESNGYDGVILQNDVGSFGRTTDAYIALRPEQVKNVDNTAPTTNPDIRYSRRDSSEGLTKEEARAQAQAYTRLKAENAALQRRLEYWQGQNFRTKKRTISRIDTERYAKQLIKQFSSEVDIQLVIDALNQIGDALVQNESNPWGTITEVAMELAYNILSEVEVADDTGYYGDNTEILREIREATFKLSAEDIRNLPEGFRKQYRNKLHISTDKGRSVDSVYMELQEDNGYGLFPQGIYNVVDQLIMIGEAYDTLSAEPQTYNPYENHMNEAVITLANDIINGMLGDTIKPTPPTRADEAAARIEQIKREEAAKRKEMRAKEKAAKWDKVEAVKKHYQGIIQRQREARRESAAAKKYRDNVYDKGSTLMSWLIKNSDKEHVPEALKEPLIAFLSSIDLSSKHLLKTGEATKKDASYRNAIDRLIDIAQNQQKYLEGGQSTEDDLNMFLDFGDLAEYMVEHRNTLVKILGERANEISVVAYMNAEQLKELDHILTVLTTAIRKVNKFLTDSHYASVIDAARKGREAVDALSRDEVKKILGAEGAERFLTWSNTIPYYAFKRFGEAGSERFEAFIMGWAKMAMNIKAIQDFTKGVYDAEQVKAWESELHDFEFRGQEFKMSTAQIMGLYCSSKREQAMKHLDVGGMRIDNIETKGKLLKSVIEQKKTVHLTAFELAEVVGVLSEEQIKVANELQKFMNTVCSDWGNEISMERFGYRQFTETNYYPIKSVEHNLDLKDKAAEETDLFRLINMSATKALNPKANNAILISSIFDVFAAHSADMAKYNGLALPVLDMVKWYNYREKSFDEYGHMETKGMHKSIEAAFGTGATNYVSSFIKDLNGIRSAGRADGFVKGLTGRYKAAAVAMNLRVIAQQPTSIVRAAYMIDKKYLVQGASIKGGVKEAMEHSGLAQWKSMGFFDTNIARGVTEQIKGADSAVDKVKDLSMKGAEKADEITWGAIWNACKLEQMDKGLSGKALMEATTKRFEQVIVATQVIDSTITKSHLMRDQNAMTRELTSFKAEPTVTYNILLDSMMELVMERKRTGNWQEARKKAWPMMWRAGATYVVGQFATAAAAAIVDALRDDDEYQNYIEKWLEHLWSNFGENLKPWNLVPVFSEIINVLFNGETKELMMFQSLEQLRKGATAALDILKSIVDPDAEMREPNRTDWGRLYQAAQALSSLTGIPVSGFMRDFAAIWNNSGGLVFKSLGKFRTYESGVKNEVRDAVKDEYLEVDEAIAILLEAGEISNADEGYWLCQEWLHADDSEWTRYNDVYSAVLAGTPDAYELALDELGDHGIAAQSVRTDIKRQIGRWFVGGEDVTATMDEKVAVKALQDYAGLLPLEAQHYIDELKFEKQHKVRWSDMKAEYIAGTFSAGDVRGFRKTYGHEKLDDINAMLKEWDFEKATGIAWSQIGDAYVNDDITREQYIKYQREYGGLSPVQIDEKLLALDATKKYGVRLGSTTAGIKANVIEGLMSPETAKNIMMIHDGKSEREAEAYTNQYLFEKETGYSWSDSNGVMEAYEDGAINDNEALEWFKAGLVNGTDEVAGEYLQVAQWRSDVPGAEKMNREGVQKWNKYGKNIVRVGLGKAEFADAWRMYSAAKTQYDSEGNVVKEKKMVFFDELYSLYKSGVYTLDEIDGIAKSVYASSTVKKYAPW